MASIFDGEEDPQAEEEWIELRNHAMKRFRQWRRRAGLTAAGFILCCLAVTPFLYGGPLYAYWNTLGKFFLLLSMGMLPVATFCGAMFWVAWKLLREARRCGNGEFAK